MDAADRERLSEQVALYFATALLSYPVQLIIRLDTFGSGRDTETCAQIDDGLHNGSAILGVSKFANEGLVDLDLVKWKEPQIAQR
jgi:hypothetical protein